MRAARCVELGGVACDHEERWSRWWEDDACGFGDDRERLCLSLGHAPYVAFCAALGRPAAWWGLSAWQRARWDAAAVAGVAAARRAYVDGDDDREWVVARALYCAMWGDPPRGTAWAILAAREGGTYPWRAAAAAVLYLGGA